MQAEALVPQPAYGYHTMGINSGMQAEALVPQSAYGYHTTPQPYHNVTPTHIEPDQRNP